MCHKNAPEDTEESLELPSWLSSDKSILVHVVLHLFVSSLDFRLFQGMLCDLKKRWRFTW